MCVIAQTHFGIQRSFGTHEKRRPAMAPQSRDQDWRCIAEKASREMDPDEADGPDWRALPRIR